MRFADEFLIRHGALERPNSWAAQLRFPWLESLLRRDGDDRRSSPAGIHRELSGAELEGSLHLGQNAILIE